MIAVAFAVGGGGRCLEVAAMVLMRREWSWWGREQWPCG